MDEHPMTRAQRLRALFFSTLYICTFYTYFCLTTTY